jgi:hypothetical protein
MSRCHFLSCQDFFESWDVIFWTVKTFMSVETLLFELWRLFWQSRRRFLSGQDFVDSWDVFLNCWDFFDSWDVFFKLLRHLTFLRVEMFVFWTVETFSQSKCHFMNCQDFFDSSDVSFWTVETKSLDQDQVKTSRDLQAYKQQKTFATQQQKIQENPICLKTSRIRICSFEQFCRP